MAPIVIALIAILLAVFSCIIAMATCITLAVFVITQSKKQGRAADLALRALERELRELRSQQRLLARLRDWIRAKHQETMQRFAPNTSLLTDPEAQDLTELLNGLNGPLGAQVRLSCTHLLRLKNLAPKERDAQFVAVIDALETILSREQEDLEKLEAAKNGRRPVVAEKQRVG